MQTKVLLILLFSLPAYSAEKCEQGEVRYIHNKKSISQKLKFCVEETNRGSFVLSDSCSGKACKLLENPAARPVDLTSYKGTVGSPGFKVCRELGGQPQIFEYKFNSAEDWTKDSRCIFSEKDFVSNDVLLTLWKDYMLY